MEFKKKIKQRICLSVIYLILGIVLCVLNYMDITTNKFVSTFGAALAVAGLAKIIQNARLMSSADKMQLRETAEKDERNIMLWEKARSLTFAVYIFVAAIAMVVCLLLELEFAGQIIAYNICGIVFVYWICYAIIKRKY